MRRIVLFLAVAAMMLVGSAVPALALDPVGDTPPPAISPQPIARNGPACIALEPTPVATNTTDPIIVGPFGPEGACRGRIDLPTPA